MSKRAMQIAYFLRLHLPLQVEQYWIYECISLNEKNTVVNSVDIKGL